MRMSIWSNIFFGDGHCAGYASHVSGVVFVSIYECVCLCFICVSSVVLCVEIYMVLCVHACMCVHVCVYANKN